MNEFFNRQRSLIQQSVAEYRKGARGLNELIKGLESVGSVIGGSLWDDHLFEFTLDLERINSEIIDKGRSLNSEEVDAINRILTRIDALMTGLERN